MGNIGFKNKIKKPNKKTIAIFLIIILVLAALAWGGKHMLTGNTKVNFKVLKEGEIPQEIVSQVIPEYRQLERALACLVDEKVYVIATRGEKPTSGYEISIDKMEIQEVDGNKNLIVYSKFKDPQPGMSLTQALTYPIQVAETDLKELPKQIQLKVQYIE